MTHDGCQLVQTPLDRHSCGVRAGPAHHGRDLLVTKVELDSHVDELALLLRQLSHGTLVQAHRVRADGVLEGRRRGIHEALGGGLTPGPTARPTDLVSNSVENGLAYVGLEASGVP